jgi:uncharacterized RDD family membrane protein YckC
MSGPHESKLLKSSRKGGAELAAKPGASGNPHLAMNSDEGLAPSRADHLTPKGAAPDAAHPGAPIAAPAGAPAPSVNTGTPALPPGIDSSLVKAPAGPHLWRRMACWAYEGVLLFGVLMIAAYLYSSLTQQRHALQGRHGLQAFLFLVLGIYFVWFWARSGQTVAMKAWHLRVVGRDGGRLSQGRALLRYLLSWLWFLPGVLIAQSAGFHSGSEFFGILAVWVLAYALMSLALPKRQFLHDVWCGSQLVHQAPAPKSKAPL